MIIFKNYGTDKRKSYNPYIKTSKFNSIGTTTVITDWKTGRGIHCLSQGEALWYYILRWNDENVDIKEQFPLDMVRFNEISDEIGIARIHNAKFKMSTDFLVIKKNKSMVAYSIKNDRNLNERTLQLLYVEKMYWISQNIRFEVLFKEDVNKILSNNIRLIVEFYHLEDVVDKVGYAKHLLATKKVTADLTSRILDTNYLDELGLIK